MKNIAVIGLGALGKRHLEAILKSSYDMNIYCIDMYEKALDGFTAKDEFDNKKIFFDTDVTFLPEHLDFVLFSMSAAARREMFDKVVEKSQVDYVIFEKVLFQKEEDYHHVKDVLTAKGIKAWVNCSRRVMPIWKSISELVCDESEFEFHVAGGSWGMGCNSIHMLDIIAYLAADSEISIYSLNLINNIIDSKRSGYKEFFGAINGDCGKCRSFSITCYDTSLPMEISIVTPNGRININEGKCEYTCLKNGEAVVESRFAPVYQSGLTNLYLDSIFGNGGENLCLTSYDESMKIHLALIRPLTEFFVRNGVEERICPIT